MAVESKTSPERQRGRPKGSVTQDRPPMAGVVARDVCPHCGAVGVPSNKVFVRGGKASGAYRGIAYGAYRHYRANCSACAKAILYTEYHVTEKSET